MIMMRLMMMMVVLGVLMSVLQSQPQCKMVGGMEMRSHTNNTLVVYHTI